MNIFFTKDLLCRLNFLIDKFPLLSNTVIMMPFMFVIWSTLTVFDTSMIHVISELFLIISELMIQYSLYYILILDLDSTSHISAMLIFHRSLCIDSGLINYMQLCVLCGPFPPFLIFCYVRLYINLFAILFKTWQNPSLSSSYSASLSSSYSASTFSCIIMP